MNRFFAQSLLPSLILFAFYFFLIHDSYSQETDHEVLLIDWQSMDCDDTYDPDRLKSRITFMDEEDGLLTIQVNFSDNCCADFTPGIKFSNNRLDLISATEEDNEFCFCDCCFSLEYKIVGLQGKSFEVYFDGKKVEVSGEHYETQEESFDFYQGERINFTNKYGFKEGRWMSFHENGQLEQEGEFPVEVLYYEENAIWYKIYNEDGRLVYFDRKDSTQAWFEDGTIKEEHFFYTKGDTSFEYMFRKHTKQKMAEKFLLLSYPHTFKSELNPCFKREGVKRETIYKETFYYSGTREYLLSKDSVYKWYENGNYRQIDFPNGSKRFREDGSLSSQVFRWKTPGPACKKDLSHNLYVYYNTNASIKKINLSRDEALEEKVFRGEEYIWTWDEDKKLTASPEDWREAFPWQKFELVLNQLKDHQLP